MKARNEMNPEFMWDFSHMFADRAAWEAAYADCEADIHALSALPGTLCASADTLKDGLDKIYAAAKKAGDNINLSHGISKSFLRIICSTKYADFPTWYTKVRQYHRG